MVVHYDPFSDEILDDPHPFYRVLRDHAPAYYLDEFDAWFLSRFEDIWEQTGDTKSYSAAARGTTPAHLLTDQLPVLPSVNFMDPPEHVRNRALISGAFKPLRVAALEPLVREIVGRRIDAIADQGGCDLVGDYIAKVSMEVSCNLLGLPVEDGDFLVELVNRFFEREPGHRGMTEGGLAAAGELNEYLEVIVRQRRKTPAEGDVLINVYLGAEFDGKPLPDENIASQMATLVIGSSDSFPKVFAAGLLELQRNPAQRDELKADRSLLHDAFQEILRFGMPTQMLGRTLTRDVEIRGETMKAGQAVMFLLVSANRDVREFNAPDRFDIRRNAKRMLTFGHGSHACLGTHIAELEGEVALGAVLDRIPDYRIDESRVERLRSEFVAGITALPATY
ncbi:MAG: cytochrome P450 [Deltaproteobacteria bacterium]|nr:cytochrome P450 [Deltaproteobacteria bacterium]MBW2446741.1 cytochrome P450 [Deltaproteobacteria bacterium]